MVGTKQNGDMVDNNVEATPGDVIDQVYARSKNSYGFRPNVVLGNAGTNDAVGTVDIPNAGNRMESLMSDLWAADDMADTLIVLSTVLPNTNSVAETNRLIINQQYRSLIISLRARGRPIVLADMDYLTTADLNDGTHPTDAGYVKMAYIWWVAIKGAYSDGLIPQPASLDGVVPENTCDKAYGSGVYAGGLTQRGSGVSDGIYYHDSVEMVAYGCWKKNGAKFTKIADLSVNDNCIPRGVHFIDVNGEGYDDFACVGTDGNVYVSINQKDGTDTKPPTFKAIGLWKKSEGYAQANVRLGDVDGDGRADYCVVQDNGNILCWRNGWTNDVPAYWQALGQRFTGATTTYTNARSCMAGVEGNGLNIGWRQGFHKGAILGPTHTGMSGFVTDEETYLRNRIHFARVYGEAEDFGLLGRQDYVFFEHTEDDGTHTFKMHVWKNVGYGSTKLEGKHTRLSARFVQFANSFEMTADGDKYCNMMGHDDGREDYVWTLSKGEMRLYPNKGLKSIVGDECFWDASTIIWDPTTQAIGKYLDRRDLHLVDWDGDGACAIVRSDPDNDNRVQLWLNKYPTTGAWNWAYNSNPAPSLYCPETRGIGIQDLPVQFGDLTGNGRADYICIEKDGRSWGFFHNDDDSWTEAAQFKFSEGKDRANLRWADVNGDGKDDMIWVDKFNRDGTVWYSEGAGDPADNSGSSVHWRSDLTPVYEGSQADSCEYYPDLDGDGRADMHSILGTWKNQAETWFSRCGLTDATGDDPGGIVDPGLPALPADPDNPSDPGGSGIVHVGQDIFVQPRPTDYNHTMHPTISTSRDTQTTTLTVPAVTTSVINFWEIPIPDDEIDEPTGIWVTSSIDPTPFVITNTYTTGPTPTTPHVRTIAPPPWPWTWTTSPGPPSSNTRSGDTTSHIPTGITFSSDDPDNGSDPDDPDDTCQPDIDTSHGLCSNGNYLIYNAATDTVSCDHSIDDAPEYMTECQSEIDGDLDAEVESLGQSSSCCSNTASLAEKLKRMFTRQASSCGANPNFPSNLPANGAHHSVWTCDYNLYPNVCANAQSAILQRQKPPILTYPGPSSHLAATKPCGNPNRNPDWKIWDEQSVLRLIPEDENGAHGNAMSRFYSAAGNGNYNQAWGLIYSVAFTNGPAANPTTDSDFYLGTDATSSNINYCAQPYGIPFLLVNSARVSAGQRSYEPGNRWYSCDNFPGYSGLANMRKRGRRRQLNELSAAEIQQLHAEGSNITVSDGSLELRDPDETDESWVNEPLLSRLPAMPIQRERGVKIRQLDTSGGFLYPAAYVYLGCGNTDDDDCAIAGVKCGVSDDSTIPNADDNPTPTTTATASATATATATATALPLPVVAHGSDTLPYCFRDHNADSRWDSFNQSQASTLLEKLCNVGDVLPASNEFGYVYKDDSGLVASVTWADDQTGCEAKSDVPIASGWCKYSFDWIASECDDGGGGADYGGAFIETASYGCVQWWIAEDSTST
ncbi:killer toxin subunits alpha beta [Seiridium cupressi]